MKTVNGIQIKPMESPETRPNYHQIFEQLKVNEGFEIEPNKIQSVRTSASNYKNTHPDFDYATWKSKKGFYKLIRIERN